MSQGADHPETVDSRRVARGLGSTILARAGAVVEIVAQPLYVLMFGLASYGMYAVMWAAVNLMENLFDFGMTSAMQRTVPKSATDAEAADALRTAIVFGVGPCIVVALLISLFAADLAPLLNVATEDERLLVPAVQLFVWALPLWAFVEIATSAMRARMVFGAEIRLRVVWEQIIRLAVACTLFIAGYGVWGLFVAHLISLSITAVLCVRLLRQYYRLDLMFAGGWWSDCARHTFWAGVSMLPSNIVTRIFSDSPTVILNQLLPGAEGARASGLFTIARKLSSVVQLVRIAFIYVMAPLAASAERTDRAHVAAIYSYAVRVILAIAFPLAAALAGGRYAILSLFGKQADVAAAAVIILLFGRALEAVLGISLPVLQVIAHYKHQVTASVVGVAVAVLAGREIIGPVDPLTGITLAMAIGFVVMGLIPMVQLWLAERLHPFDSQTPIVLLKVGVISIGAGIVSELLTALPDEVAIPLVLVVALGAIWLSMRIALPLDDRASLGKLAKRLRLVPADAAPIDLPASRG